MADFSPLLPGDPARLGGLELLGRLGEGGQGVVYLARTPMDVRVAVKWLRPSGQDGFGRFLREAEVAQRVAPFCTAAVLSTGVEQGRPYIVSEYVEGRSLERVVREDGPLAGGDLERLAIGTATALAAVHQAGVVHRDFKPGNVIMGATGPRVIDFGIARALGPATLTSSTQIGTPAYMAPEQVMGRGVGPAADLFAWAGTMVFASCGRAPFGVDGAHAVMSRVLSARPDLGSLDGPLGDLVLRCLAKEPSSRPAAMDVIACLLRNPEPGSDALAAGARQAVPGERSAAAPAGPLAAGPDGPLAAAPAGSLAGGPGDEVRRAGRSRPPVAAVLAATAALAVTAVLVAGLAAVPGWLRRPALAAEQRGGLLPSGRPLRDRAARRRDHPPRAPVRPDHPDGVRGPRQEARRGRRLRPAIAAGHVRPVPGQPGVAGLPDGRFLAGRPDDYTSDGYDSLLITDRRDGSSFRVKTVRKPLDTSLRAWSRDGSRILLNLDRKTEDERGEDVWTTLGFAVVDVARREADVVRVADDAVRGGNFGWDGAERGVVAVYGGNEGLRFFDAAGRRTRDVPGIGPLASGTLGIFSPRAGRS
ncbi:serine/threonine protein kinase [Nonomuraea thailandensis]